MRSSYNRNLQKAREIEKTGRMHKPERNKYTKATKVITKTLSGYLIISAFVS